MMRSPAWYSRFFESEEHKLSSSGSQATETKSIQLRITLPTVEANDAGVPYSAYYYSIPHRQKWLFRVLQCRLADDFYALYSDLEKEEAYLGQLQKSMFDSIQSQKAPTNTEEYNAIHNQLLSLTVITRGRLTLIEMECHLYISEDHVSNNTCLIKKDYVDKMREALSYLAVISVADTFYWLVQYDAVKTVPLRRIFFSIFSSVRNTAIFAGLDGAENILAKYSTLIKVLANQYYACNINDIKSFNIQYFKQIIGEELQATFDLYDMFSSAYQDVYPEPVYFKMFIASVAACCKIADVYFKKHEYKLGLMYLDNALGYAVNLSKQIYDHLEISHKFPFGSAIFQDSYSVLPSLKLLEEGMSRIHELKARIDSVKALQTTINIPLNRCLLKLEELAKTDNEIALMIRAVTTGIMYIDQLISTEKTKAVEQQVHDEYDQLLEKIRKKVPVTPAISVADIKSKDVILEKQKPRKVNDRSTKREEPYTTLPASLPSLIYTQPEQVKDTLTKEPTIRISEDEILNNKKLKQQRYEEEEKKKADILAKQQAAEMHAQDANIFEYEFTSVVSEKKVIKARLDYQACIDVMGERDFYQILPELITILKKGRDAGLHGTGRKFVPNSEKKALDIPENLYCFKLKPSNHKVRIYGVVVTENGEDKITYNMPRFGKLHNTVAHLPRFKI